MHVINSCKFHFAYSFKFREKFENTKGVIRSRKSKKDSQHNGQMKKSKRTNNDLESITKYTEN